MKSYTDKDIVPHNLLQHRLNSGFSTLYSIHEMLACYALTHEEFLNHELSPNYFVKDSLRDMHEILNLLQKELNEYYNTL